MMLNKSHLQFVGFDFLITSERFGFTHDPESTFGEKHNKFFNCTALEHVFGIDKLGFRSRRVVINN